MSPKKVLSAVTAVIFTAALFVLQIADSIETIAASAADIDLKFDFGSTLEKGYTQIVAEDIYDQERGYGFSGEGVQNVTSVGKGIRSDAVQFDDSSTEFCVDLPKGLYKVSVTLGDNYRTNIYIEDMLQISYMAGNNAANYVIVPITDGQLNIRPSAHKKGYTCAISALGIYKVSDDTTYPRTIWLCGDSTVRSYYPVAYSQKAGWGQVFDQFVDSSKWQVRNMASGAQYARGFLTSGQFSTVEYYGKPGDIFFIAVGINDTLPRNSNEEDYYEAVTEMTQRAKAKGITVYLVKQQGKAFDVAEPDLRERWFGYILDRVGEEQNVAVLDLFNAFHDYCVSIGQEATDALYMPGDPLHTNRQGAMKVAELVYQMVDWGDDTIPTEPPTESTAEKTTETVTTTTTTAAVTTTSVTTTTAAETGSSPSAVVGDANGDGVLNVCDAAEIAKMLAHGMGDKLPASADFNGDGRIDVRDAAAIAKFLSTAE